MTGPSLIQEIQDQQETTPPSTEQLEKPVEPTPIDVEALKRTTAQEVSALYMGALGEKSKQITDLQTQLDSFKAQRPVVEEVTDGATFLTNPRKHVQEVVSIEMERQLQPIKQLWQEFAKTKHLENAKRQFSSVPVYKQILDTYGDVVDQLIGTNEVTPQSVQAAILMVPGLLSTGQLATRDSKSTMTPPNISSSAPPAPRKQVEKPLDITEEEKLIARRLGKTDTEYVFLRDASSDVSTWSNKEKK